jgi:hypothetical protein
MRNLEELEETDELMDSRVQSSCSEDEDSTEETEVTFREVAYACEPESLDRQQRSMLWRESTHFVVQMEQNTFSGANKGCIFL